MVFTIILILAQFKQLLHNIKSRNNQFEIYPNTILNCLTLSNLRRDCITMNEGRIKTHNGCQIFLI